MGHPAPGYRRHPPSGSPAASERPGAGRRGDSPGPPKTIELTVNGRVCALQVPASASLLQVLRNDLGLNGPKYGCGLGECGACAVLVDGVAARACVIPVGAVARRQVTTLEGLGSCEAPHPVQQAFIDEQAAQCGYCLNGMIISTLALLRHTPRPSEREVRDALAGNLCRCGTHLEILRAVQRAAVLMAPQEPAS